MIMNFAMRLRLDILELRSILIILLGTLKRSFDV